MVLYKVMLVDDDFPTIEFLTEVVDWDKLGLKLISTHDNGISAYESAKKEMPDILITDIGMPKMDGIELTQKLKELKTNLQVAIISCHNEFNYAQKALKLNVQDYVLKETLDPEDLQNILRKCKERLDNEKYQKGEVQRLRHQVNQNHDLENQRLLKEFIQGASNRFHQERLQQDKYYIPVLFLINHFYIVKNNYVSEETLLFAIQNIAEEMILKQETHALFIHYEQNKGVLLYPNSNNIKRNYFDDLRVLLNKIQQAINQFLHIQITFLIGDNKPVYQIKKEIHYLVNSDKQLFYLKQNSITDKQKLSKASSKNNRSEMLEFYQEIISRMKKAIFQRDRSELERQIHHWSLYCQKEDCDPETVKEGFLRMLLELKMKLSSVHYYPSNYQAEAIQKDILMIASLEELKEYVLQYLINCLGASEHLLKSAYHKDVLSACYYVSSNIESKFSLDEVADHLYLNPSYFSRLFKKEMNITFVEYIKQQKIQRAKELLEFTTDPIGQICERLGYDNQSYFIKIFKKQTGCTPLEYRNKLLQGVLQL